MAFSRKRMDKRQLEGPIEQSILRISSLMLNSQYVVLITF